MKIKQTKAIAVLLAFIVSISIMIIFSPDSQAACKHKKTGYSYEKINCGYFYDAGSHNKVKKCKSCGKTISKTKEKHSWGSPRYEIIPVSKKGSVYHDNYHNVIYKCSKCKQKRGYVEKHTFKNGKCTKCRLNKN